MTPLAEALALLLLVCPALPAQAQGQPDPPEPPAETVAEKPAGEAPEADPVADLQKMYDQAIASEKESGKTMVWDGDKMIPAPDNFQNPLTPDAMAAGWRPVVVGGEVVGACNGNQCTAQGLQPDLFGPPPSGTAADNLNASATPPDATAPGEPAAPPIPTPKPGQEAGRQEPGTGTTAPPAPTQENFAAVNNFVTTNAENDLAGKNDPNSGTGSPNFGTADNPATGMAFAPDGSGAFNLPPTGSTGGNGIGGNGVVSQGAGSTGGDTGRAINCKAAGNCGAVTQNLIDFHEGLKNGRVSGPSDPNVISVAQAADRLKRSGAYNEALGIQTRSANGVAAVSGALADGAELDDQGASDAGGNFDGTGANRAPVPTKKCGRHIMGQVGVCPSSD